MWSPKTRHDGVGADAGLHLTHGRATSAGLDGVAAFPGLEILVQGGDLSAAAGVRLGPEAGHGGDFRAVSSGAGQAFEWLMELVR